MKEKGPRPGALTCGVALTGFSGPTGVANLMPGTGMSAIATPASGCGIGTAVTVVVATGTAVTAVAVAVT